MSAEVIPVLTALVALIVVLGLIWLAGRLARISGVGLWHPSGTKGRLLSVEESLAVDQRRRLLLLRCENRRVLVMTGGTDVVLGWLPVDPSA